MSETTGPFDFTEMFKLLSQPDIRAKSIELHELPLSKVKESLETEYLSTRGTESEQRIRLLRFKLRRGYPDVQVPWYPEQDEDLEKKMEAEWKNLLNDTPVAERTAASRYGPCNMKMRQEEEDYWKSRKEAAEAQCRSGVGRTLQAERAKIEAKKLDESNKGSTKKQDRTNSNKIIQDDVWSDKSNDSDVYVDDKKTIWSDNSDYYDQYDDAQYRLNCMDLLKSWDLKCHSLSGTEASDFLGYLNDFRKFARISDDILLEMLPTIFDSSTRDWYRHAEISTWRQFENAFSYEFVTHGRPKAQSAASQPANVGTAGMYAQNQPMTSHNQWYGATGMMRTPQVVHPMYQQFNQGSGNYSYYHPDYNTYY